jgi:phosphohistidine swiveling domain-containing protein
VSDNYFQEHLSLSDWLIGANIQDRDEIVREDATKRDRLRLLNQIIGLPIVPTTSLTTRDIIDQSDTYLALLSSAGDTPYAVRAVPRVGGLPVLRNRRLPVRDLVKWLFSMGADLNSYDLSFEVHIDPVAAALFVVGPKRVFGEAAHGGILQLNKGSLPDGRSLRFEFDYQRWHFSRSDTDLESFLRAALDSLRVADEGRRSAIAGAIASKFTSGYLNGYFEVISSPQRRPVFIDFNRELLRNAEQLRMDGAILPKDFSSRTLRGQPASRGVVSGRARVLKDDSPGTLSLRSGEILVCHFTSPAMLPLIMQAAAVVTDVGGVLSHAAIVCRELQKPCVVGLKTATIAINDLEEIEVDGEHGIIRVFGGQDG